MNLLEITANIVQVNDIQEISSYSEYSLSTTEKFLNIENYIIHEIELLNKSYQRAGHTSIDLGGTSIGDIYYLKDNKIEISQMTVYQFYIFLHECNLSDLVLYEYTFKKNYLLIHEDYIDEYHYKYNPTSSVWGGFKILDSTASISYYQKTVTNITIPFELRELDYFAQDSVSRALDQNHAFERFLKLYHLLELEFDYSLIQKIKLLDIQTDSNQIGSLLNEYSRNEIDRLIDLISNTCTDVSALATKLNLIKGYKTLGEEIFIKFSKGKNSSFYLVDISKYNDLLNDPGCFSDQTAVHLKASIKPIDYDKFIHTITAYWIYRIRCSIAHFKIGEYILTKDKEDFIVEFAEPLITEVLIQFYKK